MFISARVINVPLKISNKLCNSNNTTKSRYNGQFTVRNIGLTNYETLGKKIS